jgi:hypothetical protein
MTTCGAIDFETNGISLCGLRDMQGHRNRWYFSSKIQKPLNICVDEK